MLVVVALGGNALLRRGEPADAATQRAQRRGRRRRRSPSWRASTRWSSPTATGRRSGCSRCRARPTAAVEPYPLDVLGAESEGMIGYLLDQELVNALGGRPVATLLTQVIVDRDDPAFARPRSSSARSTTRPRPSPLAGERGWTRGARRPPLAPRRALARTALDRRAADDPAARRGRRARRLRRRRRDPGRGRPRRPPARRRGGDRQGPRGRAAGRGLEADALLMLTDVDAVEAGLRHAAGGADRPGDIAAELRALDLRRRLDGAEGRGRRRFVEATGGLAAIGALADAAAILRGERGTRVHVSADRADDGDAMRRAATVRP